MTERAEYRRGSLEVKNDTHNLAADTLEAATSAEKEQTAEEAPHSSRPSVEAVEDVRALREALASRTIVGLALYFVDYTLRAQEDFFENIHAKRQLTRITISMSLMAAVFVGAYGAVMGIYNGPLQALSSCIKLPILFLLTALICLPSLYVFNVLLGQRFRFMQTAALMAAAIGTTSILLASLAPLSFFFWATTDNYPFLKLMHVAVLGLSGYCGIKYLHRGCNFIARRDGRGLNEGLLQLWIAIYALVGCQLGWRLRPFLGALDAPFEVLRPAQGNIYIEVLSSLRNLFP